jgi:hypothetical protein
MDELQLMNVLQLIPLALGLGGLFLVMRLGDLRLPADIRRYVLACLSETEPLPATRILGQPLLAGQGLDVGTLTAVLDGLCREGAVVRWRGEHDRAQIIVYCHVARPSNGV